MKHFMRFIAHCELPWLWAWPLTALKKTNSKMGNSQASGISGPANFSRKLSSSIGRPSVSRMNSLQENPPLQLKEVQEQGPSKLCNVPFHSKYKQLANEAEIFRYISHDSHATFSMKLDFQYVKAKYLTCQIVISLITQLTILATSQISISQPFHTNWNRRYYSTLKGESLLDPPEEDLVNPLPIIIDRRRPAPQSNFAPHRKRAATVSTRTFEKTHDKTVTIPTMFVWECGKPGRKISGTIIQNHEGRWWRQRPIFCRYQSSFCICKKGKVFSLKELWNYYFFDDKENAGGEKVVPKEVFLSGSFNGWQPIRMNLSENNFYAILDLPEGNHEYKFQVDGLWQHNNKEPVTR